MTFTKSSRVCLWNSAISSPSPGGIILCVENSAISSPSSEGIIMCVCGEQCYLITITRRYNPACVWRTVQSHHHHQKVQFCVCVENSGISSPSSEGTILCVCGEQWHLITIIRRYNSVCVWRTVPSHHHHQEVQSFVCGEQCHLITIIRRYNSVCVWRTVLSHHHHQEVQSFVCGEQCHLITIIRRYNPVCVWRTVLSYHHRQEV